MNHENLNKNRHNKNKKPLFKKLVMFDNFGRQTFTAVVSVRRETLAAVAAIRSYDVGTDCRVFIAAHDRDNGRYAFVNV